MKIIATGSLGNISKPLTKELIQKGHSVTVSIETRGTFLSQLKTLQYQQVQLRFGCDVWL
jgi:glycogen synthase